MSLWSITLILFLIIDPVGKIGSFQEVLKTVKRERQRFVFARELLFAYVLMLFFNLLGESLLDLLQISETAVRLTSGVILFFAAIKILFPSEAITTPSYPHGEPFLVPLAIPTVAGPALLATIMLFADIVPSVTTMVLATTLAWLAGAVVLAASPILWRVIGSAGLMACERLMGMVLVLLSIQRFMDGISSFLAHSTT